MACELGHVCKPFARFLLTCCVCWLVLPLQLNSFLGQDEPITSIAFSPDDERLAGVSADGKLLVYIAGNPSEYFDHVRDRTGHRSTLVNTRQGGSVNAVSEL